MSPDSCAGNVIYDDDDQSRIQALHPKSATGLEAKSPSCTTRCSRPGVARAAASAALLVATTLLLSGRSTQPLPFSLVLPYRAVTSARDTLSSRRTPQITINPILRVLSNTCSAFEVPAAADIPHTPEWECVLLALDNWTFVGC